MYRKASFGDRLSAFVVDQILILLVGVVLLIVLNIAGVSISIDDYESLFGLLFMVYSTVFVWRSGATLGKKLMKIKVVDMEYKHVGFWRALLRESIGRIISSILNLGYLWMLIDKRKQAWHDKLARTFVVKLDNTGNMIAIQSEEEVSGKKKILFVILFLAIGIPLLFAGLATVIYLFIGQPHKISGNAMHPNYVNGQYYLSNKFVYRTNSPQKGEVIIFKNPRDDTQDFLKRIIAVPGDQVKIQDCKVYVNNQILEEPYLPEGTCTKTGAFWQEGATLTVPADNYIGLGDNRDHSSDSREWGYIPSGNIIGRVDICYYKCSESAQR